MGDGKGFDREELAAAVRRKALGYETSESVDEYGLIDGQLALIKRRVTVKDVPPDVAAVKFLMEMYGEDTEELSGGYKALSYNGIPLVYDRFIEDGTMYLLDTSAFKLHQLCDWRYLENENGKILRQTQGKPTYTATLVKYCDLVCARPNGQAKLTGLTAPQDSSGGNDAA